MHSKFGLNLIDDDLKDQKDELERAERLKEGALIILLIYISAEKQGLLSNFSDKLFIDAAFTCEFVTRTTFMLSYSKEVCRTRNNYRSKLYINNCLFGIWAHDIRASSLAWLGLGLSFYKEKNIVRSNFKVTINLFALEFFCVSVK